MSRTLSAGYTAHLALEVQQRAVLVKITRTDGEILGFTSFDDDLLFDSVTYEAEAAVDVSDVRTGVGTGVDNLEGMGALISDRITEVDILAGLYDGAGVELFELIWSDTALGRLIYLTGSLGEFTIENPGRYKTELRSLSQHLAQQIVELASPQCRVKALGDSRCKVDLAAFQFTRAVSVVNSLTVITFAGEPAATGYFAAGRVEFVTGLNAGLEREVKDHTLSAGSAVITLQVSFPFVVAVTDTAILEAGCDRRAETCRDRFSNIINFRGENFLPGTDAILKRGRR